jgi:ribonuclease P/MRP protein subunit POP5
LLKRVKHRYLGVEIDSEDAISSGDFIEAVWKAILKLYGEYGASRTGLSLIDFNSERKLGIIRSSQSSVEMVRAALASVTRIRDKPVAMHVLTVSGTIRALRRKMEQQL